MCKNIQIKISTSFPSIIDVDIDNKELKARFWDDCKNKHFLKRNCYHDMEYMEPVVLYEKYSHLQDFDDTLLNRVRDLRSDEILVYKGTTEFVYDDLNGQIYVAEAKTHNA